MASNTQKRSRLDFATLAGILLAMLAIVGGLVLEKGSVKDIAQYTAALIVGGGTLGALLVTSPRKNLGLAISHLKAIFVERAVDPESVIEEVLSYATKARKQGIVSLEADAANIGDPFLRKAINLAVDGTDIDELKSMMELEIDQKEHLAEEAAKVYENAGGYSPTIGIIGAVLGLIQVMKNLANISEVGHGIAVAFVATIYGVALANIFLLPAASKIRSRARQEGELRELALTGVIGMIEGSNPKLIRAKLEGYLPDAKPKQRAGRPEKMAA